jgi:hypothetical protein
VRNAITPLLHDRETPHENATDVPQPSRAPRPIAANSPTHRALAAHRPIAPARRFAALRGLSERFPRHIRNRDSQIGGAGPRDEMEHGGMDVGEDVKTLGIPVDLKSPAAWRRPERHLP